MRNRRRRDARRAGGVEPPQIGEQIGGGLPQVAGRRQIERLAAEDAAEVEPGVLRAVEARNALQKTLLFQALREHFSGVLQGRVVTLWGLSFKPGTDDLREAPSLVLLDALLLAGCQVRAYDPVANEGVANRYPREVASGQLQLCNNALTAVEASEALILVTEWKQFRQPDFARVRQLMHT